MPPKTRRQTKKDISADTMDVVETMEPLDMTDAGDIDEDIERLEKEQIYLEKLAKREQLRRAVDRLKTKPVSTRDKDSTSPSASESESGTHNLRKRAEKALSRMGLNSAVTSSDDNAQNSTDASSSDDDISAASTRHKSSRRKRRSEHHRGKRYPVAIEHLRYQYASRKLKYRQLDFPLFMACELESIKTKIDQFKKNSTLACRVEHLIKMCYYSKQYEWQAILDYHSSVVDEIKSERADWGDNLVHIEAITLHPHIKDISRREPLPTPKEPLPSDIRRSLYCSEFQEGKCKMSGPHNGIYGGKSVTLHHFCRACWLKDRRQRYHAPSSDDCPHKSPDINSPEQGTARR